MLRYGRIGEPSIDPRGARNYGPPPFRARSSVVEHLTFNQEVVRSIRTGLTNEIN
jgi:hypothetical protein